MWHMGDGWGWWMLMGWVWMVVFWGLVIYGVYGLTTRRASHTSPRAAVEPTALELLARRYAMGELTDEQFETMRARLTAAARPDIAGVPTMNPSPN